MNALGEDAEFSASSSDEDSQNARRPEFSGILRKQSSVNLPIAHHEAEIIRAIRENQFIIIKGSTGCGKSTQIPNYVYKNKLLVNNMKMAVTQPRRIAAISMAKRVAVEMECHIGKEIGYQTRFEHENGSKIVFMTDGILLNICVGSRLLKDYDIIMIDEAHERTVTTDVLMGILKQICKERKDLKVIIASATINVEKFQTFLETQTVINVEVSIHHVEVIYDRKLDQENSKRTVHFVKKICEEEDQSDGKRMGDILIFLSGQEEIDECCEKLKKISNLEVLPLHGSIDSEAQQKVFKPARDGKRKVIVATNVAETSITIDNIEFVIDSGYVKQHNFIQRRAIEILETVRISKAQADQRKGRGGRTREGKCYRLYSEQKFESLEEDTVPEIHRRNLSEVCLKLYSIGYDPKNFDFLDKPKEDEIDRADVELISLKLIDNERKITKIGKELSDFPLHPLLGVVLKQSIERRCLRDVVKIIAMLTERYIFYNSVNKRNEVKECRSRLASKDGDHFSLLRIINEFEKLEPKERRPWCFRYYINIDVLTNIVKIKNQIMSILRKKKWTIEDKETTGINSVKSCFVMGYYKNICIKQSRQTYTRVSDKETFYIHPTSFLTDADPKIVLFNDAMKTSKTYMHGVLQLDEEFLRKDFPNQLEEIKFPDNIEDFNNPFK